MWNLRVDRPCLQGDQPCLQFVGEVAVIVQLEVIDYPSSVAASVLAVAVDSVVAVVAFRDSAEKVFEASLLVQLEVVAEPGWCCSSSLVVVVAAAVEPEFVVAEVGNVLEMYR